MGAPRSRGLRGLLALLAVLALAFASPLPALAGDAPDDPPPAPAAMDGEVAGAPAGPDQASGGAAKPRGLTEDELLHLVTKNPRALWAMILLRFAVAAAGLVVLILVLVRRREVRRGLVPPPVPSPPSVAPFEILGAFAVLGAWAIAGYLLASAVALVLGEPEGKPSFVTGLACMCVTSLPLAVGIAWVARRKRAERGPEAAALPAAPALRIAVGVFLVSGAVVFALQLLSAFVLKEVFGQPPVMQDLVLRVIDPKSPVEPWLIAFLGIFVAPFAEEAVFRGTLYPALRRYLGVGWAAVLVSAFFAIIHMNALNLVPLFGLALLLTWCYERTGSILAGVAVHALSNAASLVPLLLLR